MTFSCNICTKDYKSYQSLWNHHSKFHKNDNISNKIRNFKCKKCNKKFTRNSNMIYHMQNTCKIKEIINKEDKTKELEQKVLELKETIKKNNIELKNKNEIKIIDNEKSTLHIEPINNLLINIIIDNNKKIEELNNQISAKNLNSSTLKEQTLSSTISNMEIKNLHNTNEKDHLDKKLLLTLNNVDIISRPEDYYINATQLCKAGDKLFNNWYVLESTKNLIDELVNDTKILISKLIYNVEQHIWIHPDLAISLAQWISIKFGLEITKWIGNKKLLKDHEQEIKLKDQKIKLLEDLYIKKQPRKDYPQNVIYILTTDDNKKKRIYIIGKSKELKNRLSSYNKTAEHEVIYYKECKNDKYLNIIEMMVLTKLDEYKEKANRDRFVLPKEKDISFFTNIIDSAIDFF
jgi:hypothetical protein